MAKKKKKISDEEQYMAELNAKAQYPIGLLFQISILAGTVSFLLLSISGNRDVISSLFRSFIVFVGFTIVGGIVMVAIVSILHDIKMKEVAERQRVMEEERIAMLEAQEAELRRLAEEAQQRRQQRLEEQQMHTGAIPLGESSE